MGDWGHLGWGAVAPSKYTPGAYDFLLTFYITMALVVSEIIQCRKYCDLEAGVRGLKVIESGTIRYIVYGFLLVNL